MASRRKYDKERYATDPIFREQIKACGRRWRAANRSEINALAREQWHAKYRESARIRRYGLSDKGYNAILADQHGRCPICTGKFDSLCIDHCHLTGKVRGLLCTKCNLGLGYFNDDPNCLRAAAAYLEKARGIRVPVFFTILRCRVGRLTIGLGEARLGLRRAETATME